MLLSGLQGQQTLPGLSKAILDFEGLARNPISFHNHICQAGPLKLSVHAGGATDAWLAAAHSACFPASLGCPWMSPEQVSAQPRCLDVVH